MTDNEIVKALECCSKKGNCKGCPCYIDYEHTKCLEMKKGCLDLINRLQAEIEEYKADKEQYIKDYEELENNLKYAETETKFEHQRVLNLQAENENLNIELQAMRNAANGFKAENKRLKEEKEKCFYCTEQANKKISEIKAEAYKEFAERLKKLQYLSVVDTVVSVGDIDNLLKEMVGEDK